MTPFSAHIFASTDLLCWKEPQINRGMALLPPRMRTDILRYRRREDRCRSLAGRLLLRFGLRQLGFSADFSDWQHAVPDGRPFLPRRPAFSISHTGPLALCGISETVIGVDAESVGNLPLSDFKRVFTEEEIRALSAAKAPQRLFFSLWTRKEAVLKAMGTGLFYPPECINVLSSEIIVEGVTYHLHSLPTGKTCTGHAALDSGIPPTYRIVDSRQLLEQI